MYKQVLKWVMRSCIILSMSMFTINKCSAQEVKSVVQLKMAKAHSLYIGGDKEGATRLVNDSISIILNEARAGNVQPWMKEAAKIAMQMTDCTEEEIALTMKNIDLQISIKKTVDAMNKPRSSPEPLSRSELPAYFYSLERSKATMELARSRNRMAGAGHFLGQRNGTVGYRPIISFFPQGDMMTAGPVIVSPDRRYVRIGVSMTRSGITGVNTFNFSTGR